MDSLFLYFPNREHRLPQIGTMAIPAKTTKTEDTCTRAPLAMQLIVWRLWVVYFPRLQLMTLLYTLRCSRFSLNPISLKTLLGYSRVLPVLAHLIKFYVYTPARDTPPPGANKKRGHFQQTELMRLQSTVCWSIPFIIAVSHTHYSGGLKLPYFSFLGSGLGLDELRSRVFRHTRISHQADGESSPK